MNLLKMLPAFALAVVAVVGMGGGAAQAASDSRVFELRTYTCFPGKLDDLKKRFREHTMEIFERHGMKNVGYWTFQDAPEKPNTPSRRAPGGHLSPPHPGPRKR